MQTQLNAKRFTLICFTMFSSFRCKAFFKKSLKKESYEVRSGFPSGKKNPHDFSKNWACLLALSIDLINAMNQPRTGIGI